MTTYLVESNAMSNQSLVSVIIIFLNAELFFKQAIASIFEQTYGNWELLLVDDGSTDASSVIAQKYAEKYPNKVRYLEHDEHQNRGMSASRNLGIYHANGQYIAFLDADDVWLPQKLKQQVAILETHSEVGMVCGPSLWWHSWTGNLEDSQSDYVENFLPNEIIQPPVFLTKAPITTPSNILLRREAIKTVAGFEECFPGLFEDQAFYAKAYLKISVFVSNECWVKYRQHPNSCCAIALKTDYEYRGRLFFLNWLEKYLVEQGFRQTEIWKELQTELLPYRHPILHKLKTMTQYVKNISRKELKLIASKTLPSPVYHWLKSQLQTYKHHPPLGQVRLGDLRRLNPISDCWGFDRGQPVDRYYIENFLASHCDDIKGHVLEIGDSFYTKKFGGDRVTKNDVFHAVEGNPEATFVGDLTNADHIPSDTFDCLILTETLQLIYEVRLALKTIYRILKPGGVVLVTVPGITQLSDQEWKNSWYWNYTTLSAQRLFEEVFPPANIQLKTYGNVLTATAFLQGLATQELRKEELDYCDSNYEVTITVRAVKPQVTS